jgi:hypothetical protein
MKADTYTKVVLTGIAIFLGFIAFDYKPSMKAEAGIMGGGEMIAPNPSDERVWHLQNGKIRLCYFDRGKTHCSGWSD